MITKITLTENYDNAVCPWSQGSPYSVECLYPGLELEFDSNIVLLLGDNGCGKSTFIDRLKKQGMISRLEMCGLPSKDDPYLLVEMDGKPGAFCCFDLAFFRKEQPRKSLMNPTSDDDMGLAELSAGQYNLACIEQFLSQYDDCSGQVLLLDEPETSLSLRNRFRLVNRLYQYAQDHNHQLWIATHESAFLNLPDTNILCMDEVPARVYRRDKFNLDDYIGMKK